MTDDIWCIVGFVDLVGSTKMWNECGSDMLTQVGLLETVIEKVVTTHGGMIVKTIGDASMFVREFPQKKMPTIKAVQACVYKIGQGIQQAVTGNVTLVCRHKPFQVRIGMAFGRVSRRQVHIQTCEVYDYYGSTVNLASRMESKVSPPGSFTLGITDDTMKTLPSNTADMLTHQPHVTYARYRHQARRKSAAQWVCRRSQRLLCFQQRDVSELKGAAPCHTWTTDLSASASVSVS
jgi:class 3 adenylate cyclase